MSTWSPWLLRLPRPTRSRRGCGRNAPRRGKPGTRRRWSRGRAMRFPRLCRRPQRWRGGSAQSSSASSSSVSGARDHPADTVAGGSAVLADALDLALADGASRPDTTLSVRALAAELALAVGMSDRTIEAHMNDAQLMRDRFPLRLRCGAGRPTLPAACAGHRRGRHPAHRRHRAVGVRADDAPDQPASDHRQAARRRAGDRGAAESDHASPNGTPTPERHDGCWSGMSVTAWRNCGCCCPPRSPTPSTTASPAWAAPFATRPARPHEKPGKPRRPKRSGPRRPKRSRPRPSGNPDAGREAEEPRRTEAAMTAAMSDRLG